jgi:hypothetical protein
MARLNILAKGTNVPITQKVCHMGQLACRAIRVTKTREFANSNISSDESRKLACRAVSPAFSCMANLSVGYGNPFPVICTTYGLGLNVALAGQGCDARLKNQGNGLEKGTGMDDRGEPTESGSMRVPVA